MALPETQADKTLRDAWDYKGRPAVRSTTGGWTAAAMILGLSLTHILFKFIHLFTASNVEYMCNLQEWKHVKG